MAQFLYLITSHTNPAQVIRLARALHRASPDSQIAIHHDKSAEALPTFDSGEMPYLRLVPNPIACRWGDFSVTEAFLHSSKWALNHLEFDWLVWISGQDYPLGDLRGFEEALSRSGRDGALRYFPALAPDKWPKGIGLRRYYYQYYEFPLLNYTYKLPQMLQRAFEAARKYINDRPLPIKLIPQTRNRSPLIGLRALRPPFGKKFICYGGWNWCNLSMRAVKRLHDAVAQQPGIVRYYRRALLGDESFIHTMLLNMPDLNFENESYRYVKWDKSSHGTSAVPIYQDELGDVLKAGKPFARKFDTRVDAVALEQLDKLLAHG